MKKSALYILILIALTGVFSPIVRVHAAPLTGPCPVGSAQDPNGAGCVPTSTTSAPTGVYTFLAPLPCDKNASNPGCTDKGLTTFDTTTTNNLGTYLNVMIKIFIGLCAVLAVVMIVLGGIEYMTSELISSKEAGKERIRGAVFGLLLALGAYALLFTINPDILNTDLSSLKDVKVDVTLQQEDSPQTPTTVNGKAMFGGYAVGSNFATDFPQNTLASLPAGVSLNAAQCVTVGQQSCTSTLGLDPTIVNSMESDCTKITGSTCPIIITAGTEFWLHGGTSGVTSHKPGSSSVDIRATPEMNSYISGESSTFPKDGSTYTQNGICYFAESAGATSSTTASHWHVYKC